MIFETHAHYDDEQFDMDREALLASLPAHGIERVVNIGTNVETSRTSIALAQRYPFIYAAVGIHPSDTKDMQEGDLARIRLLAKEKKVVAVGEIGLDYYWEKDPLVREHQKACFLEQLETARACGLPVVIHSREAAKDTFDLIKSHGQGLGGVIHCYSYSVEMAREYVKLGYFIGIGGVLTYKNARVIREVVRKIPMERIVLETDSPYLSPVPYRGKRNSSLNLSYVVDAIAGIRGLSAQEVERATWENALHMYRIERQEAQRCEETLDFGGYKGSC